MNTMGNIKIDKDVPLMTEEELTKLKPERLRLKNKEKVAS